MNVEVCLVNLAGSKGPTYTRLHGGSTKNDQNYTKRRLDIPDIRTDLNFVVNSSRS